MKHTLPASASARSGSIPLTAKLAKVNATPNIPSTAPGLVLMALLSSPRLHGHQLNFGEGQMLVKPSTALLWNVHTGVWTAKNRGLSLVLLWPEFCFRLDAFLPLLLADLAALDVAAFDGALRRFVPLRQPVAERIPEPRRLRSQLRQAELLPDFPGALHVFALGQRERRHVAFHRSVHQERRVLFLPVLALGAVALAAMRQRLHVLERIHAICHRPQERVGVVRIDVVAHRDCDLAHVALEEGRAAQRAPHLGARHAFLAADHTDAQEPGERLVQRDPLYSPDAERVAKVREEQRLVGDALDHARFRRRDLADVGGD